MKERQAVIAPQFGGAMLGRKPELRLVKDAKSDDELSALEMAKAGWVVVVEDAGADWAFGFHRPLQEGVQMGKVQIRMVGKREFPALCEMAKALLFEKDRKKFFSLAVGEMIPAGCKYELVGRCGEKNSEAVVLFTSPCRRFRRKERIYYHATPFGEEEYKAYRMGIFVASSKEVARSGKTERDRAKGGPRNPTGHNTIKGPAKGPSNKTGPQQGKNKGFKKK